VNHPDERSEWLQANRENWPMESLKNLQIGFNLMSNHVKNIKWCHARNSTPFFMRNRENSSHLHRPCLFHDAAHQCWAFELRQVGDWDIKLLPVIKTSSPKKHSEQCANFHIFRYKMTVRWFCAVAHQKRSRIAHMALILRLCTWIWHLKNKFPPNLIEKNLNFDDPFSSFSFLPLHSHMREHWSAWHAFFE